jgi:prepilin-type processing-associated H-X9-DG protein/prepilin-type N-terminal cleavage/methylation domain-containing protein
MRRHGFTWIELAAVLAIILIIAAILFPVFARRSDQPHGPSCQQNIRQVGLAIKQYLSDYDESFPRVSSGGVYYGWADAVQPYVKNTQLFQCPNETTQPPSGTATAVIGTDPLYSDYFYNSRLAGQNESTLKHIASTVMLGDAASGNARRHSTGGAATTPGVASLVDSAGAPVGAATRHLDGANYAFADGHVKWFKGSSANTCPAIRNAYPVGAAASQTFGNPTFAIN